MLDLVSALAGLSQGSVTIIDGTGLSLKAIFQDLKDRKLSAVVFVDPIQ